MMMGGPTLPGMQQMGMSPSSLSEEQLKQLQVIMMQMQPQQMIMRTRIGSSNSLPHCKAVSIEG